MSSRPTEEEWRANLTKAYGEQKASALIATLKKSHPKKAIRTLSYMCSGVSGLNSSSDPQQRGEDGHAEAELKAAPAYAYYFTWQTPILDGIPARGTHAELAVLLRQHQTLRARNRQHPEAQALARKMASAWANFARTGNPSHPGLMWQPTNPEQDSTMIFDNECRMADDPEGEARRILLS